MDRTVDSLYQFMVDYVKEATGLSLVIRGNENGVQPETAYASVLITDHEEEGLPARVVSISARFDVFGFDENGGVFDTVPFFDGDIEDLDILSSGNQLGVFSVQFYRDGANETARRFKKFKRTIEGREFLLRQGVVHRNSSGIRQTNYQVAQKWIERASMDVTVSASIESLENYKTISEVDFVVNKDESYTVTNEGGNP